MSDETPAAPASIPIPVPVAIVAAPVATAAQETEVALRSGGQRRVNLIWEYTQAFIAVLVTGATLFVAAMLALKGAGETAAFLLLSNAFFLVIGFYFGRTNHQRTGGVGANEFGR